MKSNNPRQLVKYEIHYYHEGRFIDGVKMGEADSLILPPVEKRREFYVAEVIVEELPKSPYDEYTMAGKIAVIKIIEAFNDEEGKFSDEVGDFLYRFEAEFADEVEPVVKSRERGEDGHFTKIEEFPDSFHYAYWNGNEDDYHGWDGTEEWTDRITPEEWYEMYEGDPDPLPPPWDGDLEDEMLARMERGCGQNDRNKI